MSTKRLAIFDLDGTLVVTDAINFKAYKTALALSGVMLDRSVFDSWQGRRWDQFLPEILQTDDMAKVKDVHIKKLGFYKTFVEDGIMNDILVDMIHGMKESFHVAIVTSASRINCMEILDHLKITELFDRVLTGDDVARPKPDPEGFLKMMSYFECGPENTIIFEDSPTGVKAAQATGAQVHVVFWNKHD